MQILALLFSFVALAADPPATGAGSTYVPPSALSNPAVTNALQSANASAAGQAPGSVPRIAVPTPDTIAPPTGIPPPSATQAPRSTGRYRNSREEVNISKMILDRYKESVVRVTARDRAGNSLATSMGVGIGRAKPYIAAPLSIILGNSQQWADQIEITHHQGNKYYAQIALIDEEKNLVLLAPEASPAQVPFVRGIDERPQVSIFMISFGIGQEGEILPEMNTGHVAAASSETGVLSISSRTLDDSFAGTGILNSQGELMGMLLPGGKGVLASALQAAILKAQKTSPFEPELIGSILGRGVIVDPSREGAFKTINSALEAIKKGEAPKIDTTRFTPAKSRALAPKETDKVVIKVMPGTYKEKLISLPANTSLAGAGTHLTNLLATSADKPVLLVQNVNNVAISGFRIVPAPLQNMKAPAVIVSKSRNVTVQGNIIEAKGGVGLWLHQTQKATLAGNTFPRGDLRAVACEESDMLAEANAFLGSWSFALSIDRKCQAEIRRNLFFENKVAIGSSSYATRINITNNTFIRGTSGVRIAGSLPAVTLDDNLFYETSYAVYFTAKFDGKKFGRNASWKTKFQADSRTMQNLDTVRSEPKFENPGAYDFRIKPGSGQMSGASKTPGADLGAYQRTDFLGPWSRPLSHTLGTATGEEELAETWGIP